MIEEFHIRELSAVSETQSLESTEDVAQRQLGFRLRGLGFMGLGFMGIGV